MNDNYPPLTLADHTFIERCFVYLGMFNWLLAFCLVIIGWAVLWYNIGRYFYGQ